MPDWKIHSEFDPRLGLQTLRIGSSLDTSPSAVSDQAIQPWRQPTSGLVEIPVRSLAHEAIDGIERRYRERLHFPAKRIWPDAVELVLRSTWDSPEELHQALFFHPTVDPAEVFADAICWRAGAGKYNVWSDSTWQVMVESIKIMVRRPMRFFLGSSLAAIRQAKHDGYAIVHVRP